MHALLRMVLIPEDKNEELDVDELPNIVESWLSEERFAGEPGFFYAPIADYFTAHPNERYFVGHRWQYFLESQYIIPKCINKVKKSIAESLDADLTNDQYREYIKRLNIKATTASIIDDIIVERLIGECKGHSMEYSDGFSCIVAHVEDDCIVGADHLDYYLDSNRKRNIEDLIGNYIVLVDFHY